MAKCKLTPEQLAAVEELAKQWGKIVANSTYGPGGPGLDVDFDEMEHEVDPMFWTKVGPFAKWAGP